jgi:putative DNA-invertase from lambdoid prophage Rac
LVAELCQIVRKLTQYGAREMATYAYVRVSTDRQAEDGESLSVQQRQLEGYAQMLGLHIDRAFVERGVSGSRPLAERPEGARLLEALGAGDVVIACKLDRMFRSALDALAVLGDLRDSGVALHLLDLGGDVTGNGIAKLVFTILSAVAEAERDRTREHIIDVKRDQRARGRYLGGKVPFGYRVEAREDAKYLVEDPAQRAAIATIQELRAEGSSLRAIAAEIQRRHGVKLSYEGVREVLVQ